VRHGKGLDNRGLSRTGNRGRGHRRVDLKTRRSIQKRYCKEGDTRSPGGMIFDEETETGGRVEGG